MYFQSLNYIVVFTMAADSNLSKTPSLNTLYSMPEDPWEAAPHTYSKDEIAAMAAVSRPFWLQQAEKIEYTADAESADK